MENAKLCQACGTELNETEAFCHNCGAKYEAPVVEEAAAPEAAAPKTTFCTACGAELAEGSVFCSNCGAKNAAPVTEKAAPVVEEAPVAVVEEPEKPCTKVLGAPVMTFVKKTVLLAMALLVFISSFLPVLTVKFDLEGDEVAVNVNAYRAIGFAFDAMADEDVDDLEDSDLAKQAEEYAKEYFEDWALGENLDTLGEYYIMMYRLQLRSEYSGFTFPQLLAAMFAFVYVILAIAAFLFAIFNFLSLVTPAFADFSDGVTSMLCAIAPVAVLTYAATLIGYGSMTFSSVGVCGVGAGAVMAIVCAVLGAGYVVVDRFFLTKKDAIRSGAVVKRTLALIGCLTLLFMTFAPIMTTKVNDITFEDEEDKTSASVGIGAEFFGGLSLTPDEEEEYEDYDEMPYEFVQMYVGQMISELSLETKEAYEEGKSAKNIEIVKFLVLYDTPGVAVLYRIVAGLFILVAACAAAITWQNFRSVALGINPVRGVVLTSKIFSIVLSVFAVIFTAMFVAEAGGTIPYVLEDYYKVIIGIGPILSVVFAIFTTAVPNDNIKEAPKVVYVVQQPQQ